MTAVFGFRYSKQKLPGINSIKITDAYWILVKLSKAQQLNVQRLAECRIEKKKEKKKRGDKSMHTREFWEGRLRKDRIKITKQKEMKEVDWGTKDRKLKKKKNAKR